MGLDVIRKLRFAPHATQAYADLIADPGSGYIYPQAENIEAIWDIEQHARPFQVSDQQKFLHAAGAKVAGIKFDTEARGFGGGGAATGTTNGATSVQGENGALLKSVLGTQVLDVGSTYDAGSSGTTWNVISAAGITAGGFVGMVGTDGLYYARQVRSKASNALTVCRALPAVAGSAPTSGAAYAAAWYKKASTGHAHLFFDFETADWRRKIFGCLGTVKFKGLGARQRAMFEWEFKGIDWSSLATGQPAPTYPTNLPSTGAIMRNVRVTVGTQALLVSEFALEFNNDVQPVPATQGVNGMQKMHVKDTVRGFSFKVEYTDSSSYGATLITDWTAKTTMDVLVEITQGGPGNSFAIAIPVAEIIDVKRVGVNGLDYLEVKCAVSRNDSVPDTSNPVPDIVIGML